MSIDFNINEDFDILLDIDMMPPSRKRKRYRSRIDPFEMTDDDFYERYRFDKETAKFIIDLVNIEDQPSNRGLPISGSLQVLTALRFFARNIHQSDIGDLHGFSQSTVSRIIAKISKKLALQLNNFISFPSTSRVLQQMKSDFFQIAGFPGVIGAIDCTHVRIKCPSKNVGDVMAGHFLNRKGYYSLNVQIVCDANCKITDIVARSRGSRHDARIWNNSRLRETLESNRNIHNGVLLGDAGYPLSSILLTPVRNPQTRQEEKYNICHIATRSKIECLNGQIKSKFRSIFERLRVDLYTAKNVVVAVAVLHNIAKERNLSFFDFNNEVFSESEFSIQNDQRNERGPITARIFRQNFINRHFN